MSQKLSTKKPLKKEQNKLKSWNKIKNEFVELQQKHELWKQTANNILKWIENYYKTNSGSRYYLLYSQKFYWNESGFEKKQTALRNSEQTEQMQNDLTIGR